MTSSSPQDWTSVKQLSEPGEISVPAQELVPAQQQQQFRVPAQLVEQQHQRQQQQQQFRWTNRVEDVPPTVSSTEHPSLSSASSSVFNPIHRSPYLTTSEPLRNHSSIESHALYMPTYAVTRPAFRTDSCSINNSSPYYAASPTSSRARAPTPGVSKTLTRIRKPSARKLPGRPRRHNIPQNTMKATAPFAPGFAASSSSSRYRPIAPRPSSTSRECDDSRLLADTPRSADPRQSLSASRDGETTLGAN